MGVTDDELIERAREAREFAYAPYSNFRVGAALVATDGRIFTGCNVENSTYGLAMCAERVAIFKAVSEGAQKISRMAIVAGHERPAPPCGCCRQMVWEFAEGDMKIIIADLSGDRQEYNIEELIPHAFDRSFLEDEK